jgi:hypothetical protein
MNLFKLEVKRWWNWGWGFFSVEDQVARARPQDQKKKKTVVQHQAFGKIFI